MQVSMNSLIRGNWVYSYDSCGIFHVESGYPVKYVLGYREIDINAIVQLHNENVLLGITDRVAYYESVDGIAESYFYK